jgi:hypothetical protein
MGEATMGAKTFLAAGAVLLGVIAVAALAAFFVARDDATVARDDGPGAVRRAGAQPVVKPGNVVLLYSDERLTSDLRALPARLAGEPGPALEAAGQAVLLQRRPNLKVPVTAVTTTRELRAGGPGDPALGRFVEYWLGRAP